MRHITTTLFAAVLATGLTFAATAAAEEAAKQTVAGLHDARATLAGQQVQVAGKVVKVNNGIMGRNFLHVQDGSGDKEKENYDITITSQDTAQVGDQVTATGRVAVDVDFGYGYVYPLLLEEANIAVAK